MTDSATITIRLEKLKALRDTGVRTVKHGETLVENRPLAEIEKIIGQLEKELATAAGTAKRRLRYMYQIGKGL
ncbi:phage head-tail joining protein [Mesorhizobium sp.]|uniref:phage head-tail joining protein n=1 Tax=Mesorhizobium sp. TaxID=1871066 RepID=UPI000FE3DDB0|nr:hypothetical protein [Mesorhizobium sp.]RWQ12352.1 MAG: hypothetical protein EOR91_01160 [Mesorhizobium sp.]